MAAATSLRHVGVGSAQLEDDRYEDYPFSLDVPEHLSYALGTDATDLLAVYSRPNQRPLNVEPSSRLCEVVPDVWVRNTCTDPRRLKRAAEATANQVYRLFGDRRTLSL